MQTLTFYRLADFVAELCRSRSVVRCEALVQDRSAGQLGAKRQYKIVLTAHHDARDEVLACTLVTGECWAHFADRESWHGKNLDDAQQIVTAHLAGSGLTVLPGVYHHDPDGRATCDLWTFDRQSKRLQSAQAGQ
jgi:hypothetical protein